MMHAHVIIALQLPLAKMSLVIAYMPIGDITSLFNKHSNTFAISKCYMALYFLFEKGHLIRHPNGGAIMVRETNG